MAQADQNDTDSAAAVRRQPFSAISYVRVVKVLPDGKQQFIRNLRYPIRLARNSEGRVRLDLAPNPPPECDRPEMIVPPVCPSWPVVIFDPDAQTATHWENGERGYHGQVIVKLSPSQLEEAESSTLRMPAQPIKQSVDSLDDPNVTFEKLGEKEIEGVSATGTRVTTVYRLDQAGSQSRRVHIQEVWVSEPMQLVILMIDGDPQGEETIAGLDHISLGDHPDLFQLPAGYPARFYERSRPAGDFNSLLQIRIANDDLSLLASWFVRLPGQGPD